MKDFVLFSCFLVLCISCGKKPAENTTTPSNVTQGTGTFKSASQYLSGEGDKDFNNVETFDCALTKDDLSVKMRSNEFGYPSVMNFKVKITGYEVGKAFNTMIKPGTSDKFDVQLSSTIKASTEYLSPSSTGKCAFEFAQINADTDFRIVLSCKEFPSSLSTQVLFRVIIAGRCKK